MHKTNWNIFTSQFSQSQLINQSINTYKVCVPSPVHVCFVCWNASFPALNLLLWGCLKCTHPDFWYVLLYLILYLYQHKGQKCISCLTFFWGTKNFSMQLQQMGTETQLSMQKHQQIHKKWSIWLKNYISGFVIAYYDLYLWNTMSFSYHGISYLWILKFWRTKYFRPERPSK